MTENLRYTTSLRLKAVPPYDFSLTVHKPAGWSLLTPYEVYEDDTVWTAMRWHSGDEMLGLKLKSLGTTQKPEVSCHVFSSKKITPRKREELSETVRWMLSLDEDIREFYSLAESNRFISSLVQDLYGMRRTRRPDIFPTLVLAVTLQMAPIKRSQQMWTLLIKEYGVKARFDGREIPYWPSPEVIARTSVRNLQARCKLGYRAKVLKGIATALVKGFPTLQQLEQMTPEDAKAKLRELKGIGEYSADIVSPHPGFALDVWSAKIFNALLFRDRVESPRSIIPQLKQAAEQIWGKWRGYVFTYVLNDLDKLSKRYNIDLTAL